MKESKDPRPRSQVIWDDIRVFVAVAQAKGINKAAAMLRVTPGMISRRLDDLETRLEAKLVQRGPTGVTLTAAGEEAYDKALSMQRYADAMEDAVRRRDSKCEGPVKLASPDGIANYWLAPRFDSFFEQNPKIQIELDCGPGLAPPFDTCDIAIVHEAANARPGDVVEPFIFFHAVFGAMRSYIDRHGMPATMHETLTAHRTMRLSGQSAAEESRIRRAVNSNRLGTQALRTNSSGVFLRSLLAGTAIGMIPTYLFPLYPELVHVHPEFSAVVPLWIVRNRQTLEMARVERVADWLRSVFDAKTNPWFREEYVAPSDFAAELAKINQRAAPAR